MLINVHRLAVNQKLTIKYLTELGYRCEVASNGKECLEILKKQKVQDYEYVDSCAALPILLLKGILATYTPIERAQHAACACICRCGCHRM